MTNNLTDKFIDDLFAFIRNSVNDTAVFQAKKCVLDYLGVTLAGARMMEEKGGEYLDFFSHEKGEATLIGFGRKTTLYNAAFVNGNSAHIAELDDGHRVGMLHLGAPIISALIALAEQENIDGKTLLRGVITGYEAAARLASAIQPSHKLRGYHATGTCGTIGVALGAAAALGFTKKQMKDALSASATCSAGLLEVIEDGSELKPFNIGRAALDGLVAAYTARAGFSGPNDILGGKRGFFSVMAEKPDLSLLHRKAGDSYCIEKSYMKPYAACRHCHPAIEAAIKIRIKSGIQPQDIKSVYVHTYRLAVSGHDHVLIQGINSAKMSIPYSVAAALETGKAGIEEFMPEYFEKPNIISLTGKVKVFEEEELTALVPKKRAAIVEIFTNSNDHYRESVDFPKGEPENPFSQDDLEEKFTGLAVYGGKTKNEAEEIIRCVSNLEDDLHRLFDIL